MNIIISPPRLYLFVWKNFYITSTDVSFRDYVKSIYAVDILFFVCKELNISYTALDIKNHIQIKIKKL